MHAFCIWIHMISRIVMFLDVFQKNLRHCENGLSVVSLAIELNRQTLPLQHIKLTVKKSLLN